LRGRKPSIRCQEKKERIAPAIQHGWEEKKDGGKRGILGGGGGGGKNTMFFAFRKRREGGKGLMVVLGRGMKKGESLLLVDGREKESERRRCW